MEARGVGLPTVETLVEAGEGTVLRLTTVSRWSKFLMAAHSVTSTHRSRETANWLPVLCQEPSGLWRRIADDQKSFRTPLQKGKIPLSERSVMPSRKNGNKNMIVPNVVPSAPPQLELLNVKSECQR